MDETERFWQEWRAEADRRFGKPQPDMATVLRHIDERLSRIEDFFERLIALGDNGTRNKDGSPRFGGMN